MIKGASHKLQSISFGTINEIQGNVTSVQTNMFIWSTCEEDKIKQLNYLNHLYKFQVK